MTASCFLAFFAFGFIDNLKGPILPELLRTENLSLSQGGTLLLGAYVGFIVATLFTGFVADWLGNRKALFFAGLLLCSGLFGVSFNTNFAFLIAMMGCIGLGLGAIEVGANALIVEMHPDSPGLYLNLLATFHGIGSFLVPLYVAMLIQAGVNWQRIYLSVVVLAAIFTAAFVITSWDRGIATLTRSEWNWRDTLRVGFQGQMGWYYLLISSYVAVELGLAAWLMEYLQQVRGMSVVQSSYYLSGFFLMIMLGRFFGSFVVEFLGYLRVVGVALLGGVVCLVVGLFGAEEYILALPVAGGFFSIVFPTVTAVVAGFHKENTGAALGILFTFGGIGGALGPWIIGLMSQSFGLQAGLSMTTIFGGVAIATLLWVSYRSAKTL